MKQFFTLTVFVISLFTTKAQTSYQQSGSRIIGTVVDGSQKTIESATITLLRAQDSLPVKYSVATRNGQFTFENIAKGNYLVSVSVVGHQKGYSELIRLTADQTIQLKPIILTQQAKDMSVVTVTAKRPFIEQKIDRTVINVEASVTNAGANVLEVLEKSPGVSVDKDGNISLKGKQGVLVMIDGRPTYLGAAELANYLKGLPSSTVDQIELMTNPPAKYDASGNSGIINIKTKKNRVAGLNGNVTSSYTQGIYYRLSESFNVNYRTKKVNLFANGFYNKSHSYNQLTINRKLKDLNNRQVIAIFDQVSNMNGFNDYPQLKAGADFFLSKNTTIGVVAGGFINPGRALTSNTSYLQDATSKIDSIVYATSTNNQRWKNANFNLNYRHEFDSAGTELTSDVDYVTYSSKGDQVFNNETFNQSWQLLNTKTITSNLPSSINIYSAKADFTHPMKKGAKIEAGWKSSYVNTDNGAFYYNLVSGNELPDYGKTNQFSYKENINAGYLNFSKQYKKIGIQAGLRYENTNYSGKQFGNPTHTDSSFTRSYGNLFPTLYLSYNASKVNQFNLNFGRRVNRPAYQDLNPFLFFIDEYTYQSGNPFMKPQFRNNFELGHTYKNFLTTTISYSHTKDYMMEVFDQEKVSSTSNGYATIVRRGNIGKVDQAGLSISANVPVTKWWRSMMFTNYTYNKFSGDLNGENLNLDASNVMFNVNNQFKINTAWSAELSGFYRTKGIEGQIIARPMGQASAGISKQVLKNRGAVRLNIRDIFLTSRGSGQMSFKSTEAHFESKRDSRQATLSFSYRFGNPIKGATPKRKTGSAEDEQSRVKLGGN
ncbi:MAG: TonB-dependent receptor domain-containing protein [Candidatus Dadabacteria bacterium]